MRCQDKALFAWLLVIVAASGPGHAQGELIANGTFDTGVDGWEAFSYGDGNAEWVADRGQPPGSLRIFGGDQGVIFLDCFQFIPGTVIFEMDAFMDVGADLIGCGLNFFLYSQQEDCTGPFGVFVSNGGFTIAPEVENPNQWERLVLEVPIPNNPVDTGVRSFRVVLEKYSDILDDDACLFDNASLRMIPRGVAEIPAASRTGLFVLSFLLSLAAVTVLRRRL